MKVSFEDYDQLTVMAIKGEMLAEDIDRFRKDSIDRMNSGIRDFVIDMANLEFIDSKGLETLLWLQDQCAERLGQVRLSGLRDNIRQIMTMTRLSPRFDCHEGIDAAIKSLR